MDGFGGRDPKETPNFSPYINCDVSRIQPVAHPQCPPPTKDQDKRNFRCDKCLYAAKDSWKLKRHQSIHSDERPFGCDQCQKAYKSRSSLVRHQQVHYGYKRYKCEECNHAFPDSWKLRKHQQLHFSGKAFRPRSNLSLQKVH